MPPRTRPGWAMPVPGPSRRLWRGRVDGKVVRSRPTAARSPRRPPIGVPVLRVPFAALSLAFLVMSLLALTVAPAASAASEPKVVLIVGPTGSATASYKSTADAAATEARKYTSNVVKVYSPNATWTKVKAAVVGASVVVYLGHGNGWPSPYPYDPDFSSRDGFGLNKTAGNGDSNNTYYGETYVKTLDLAPNAIVILNHLCYASGNS